MIKSPFFQKPKVMNPPGSDPIERRDTGTAGEPLKKPSLTLIASLVAALFVVAPPVEAQQAKRPNIVMIVASPASYGNSGVKTFLANHDGVVYERDLGSGTAKAAAG